MDLDFHYGTVYVLSRWAKFGSGNSNIIASASQMVDDNYDDNPFSDAEEERNIAMGIHVRYSCQNIWGNITGKGNPEVWIPFHFLPGLVGDDTDSKLVCKKHSVLSEKLKQRLLETTLDNSDFGFRLGVGLHVFADTWAHQEFAGINTTINKVKSLIFSTHGSSLEKLLDEIIGSDSIISKIMDQINPLGHASAVHCPDMPYLWWKSGGHFKNGRKNWDEFMEASEEIFKILQQVSLEPVTGLSEHQNDLLMSAFKDIQSENIDERYNEWIRRIHANEFEIEDFDENDANAAYSIGTIRDDLTFRAQFFNEINAHFHWVKKELEDNGIFILKNDPIY